MLKKFYKRWQARKLDNSNAKLTITSNHTLKKYEVLFPLKEDFRFVHEPVQKHAINRFVGREAELEKFIERILFSEGGSFLIAGYRGVGKTSFINQVIRILEEKIPLMGQAFSSMEMVDVRLNLARPVTPSELMHYIIRIIYNRLVEKDIYKHLSEQLKEDLKLAYQRTSFNMKQNIGELIEKNFGINEAGIGSELWKASFKASWGRKQNRTKNNEFAYLGYDDKAAEYDVIKISQWLSVGYKKTVGIFHRLVHFIRRQPARPNKLKIVFIFDELDKLAEFGDGNIEVSRSVIDNILSSLKNLFTTSGITFIFIAGKDLHEHWLNDLGKGDSIYESVFSYDLYLSCLWQDMNKICDEMVDWKHFSKQKKDSILNSTSINRKTTNGNSPYNQFSCHKCHTKLLPKKMFCYNCETCVIDPDYLGSIFSDFKKYLCYKGRGIPRRIIRGFNDYVRWYGLRPMLAFSWKEIRQMHFYAELQDLLTNNEHKLFGQFTKETHSSEKDKRKLSVYYILDWILHRGNREFTFGDSVSASKLLSARIAPAEEIAPQLMKEIIELLVANNYLIEVSSRLDQVQFGNSIDRQEKRYKLTRKRLIEMNELADIFQEEARIYNSSETTINSRYKIISLLGQGGMGSVYKVLDEKTGHIVAIKTLKKEIQPQERLIKYFQREINILSRLNHPNIVPFIDSGATENSIYLVMEFIDGVELHNILKSEHQLKAEVAVTITCIIAAVAGYIHNLGIVRLDLKPSNIILSKTGKIYLLDVGIFKPQQHSPFLSGDLPSQYIPIGTPIYMGPEQFKDTVTNKSDIYALGIILYEMLAGKRPFDNPYDDSLRDNPPPLTPFCDINPVLSEIIFKCLKKQPEDRYQSMEELVVDLKAIGALWPDEAQTLLSSLVNQVCKIQLIDDIQTMPTMSLSAIGQKENVKLLSPLSIKNSNLLPASSLEINNSQPRLIIYFEDGSIKEFQLNEANIKIGRASDNDIILIDNSVSRFHAIITKHNNQLYIDDSNTANGTLVNGFIIRDLHLLQDKDIIQIGKYIMQFVTSN